MDSGGRSGRPSLFGRGRQAGVKITFLGTGTSCGVPLIGCACDVCRSADPRNRRRRSSLYVEAGGENIVIDTPPEFREQVLAHGVPRVSAVLYTHAHADHLFGLDDIRRFNTIQGGSIPAYASEHTLVDLRRIFHYVNKVEVPGAFRPHVTFHAITGPFSVGAVAVTPLSVEHGPTPTYGFRLDAEGRSVGYVPDCAAMSEEVVGQLRGLDVMILDALRLTPHSTHLSLAESVAYLRIIAARRSFITHLGHDLDHATTQAGLPAGIEVSCDGLTIEW